MTQTIQILSGGSPFGTHRVVNPAGVLPQPAERLDNDFSRIWDNEILVEVEALNVDAASFTQIKRQADGDEQKIRTIIREIVARRGKLHNPVTGSGGMLIGRVKAFGNARRDKTDLQPGMRIATLVSLSLTPLQIERIRAVNSATDQLLIDGQAVLFASGLYAKLPEDLPPQLALAILDVAGAPAQTARLVKEGDRVIIIGATGKSGILCAYQAWKSAGPDGHIIAIGAPNDPGTERLRRLGCCDELLELDATDALSCYEKIAALTNGKLADVVINCVNIPDTEMSSILLCRPRGKVYFFSMATSFTKAALGAEGVGKDIDMLIGNGFCRGHAELALNILREAPALRALYQSLYADEVRR